LSASFKWISTTFSASRGFFSWEVSVPKELKNLPKAVCFDEDDDDDGVVLLLSAPPLPSCLSGDVGGGVSDKGEDWDRLF
jgi:hypothetical protein